MSDNMDTMWQFVWKIKNYVPGRTHWISEQESELPGQWYGFAIGDKFISIEIEQAKNADDAFVREIAGKMLGYAVGSKEDLLNQLAAIIKQDEALQDEIASLEDRRSGLGERRSKIAQELRKLGIFNPYKHLEESEES